MATGNTKLIDNSYVERALSGGVALAPRNSFLPVILFFLFIFLVALIVTLIPLAVRQYVLEQRSVQFLAWQKDDINVRSISAVDYVSDLSVEEKRSLSALVHFVSEEIISRYGRNVDDAGRLAFNIVTESLIADEDPFFVASVILSESNFDRNARSNVGALGLMQIMPATGRYVADLIDLELKNKEELKNPETNLRLGIAYLKYLKHSYRGDLDKTLIAYNWGPANVNKGRKAPQVSINYSRKIKNLTNVFSRNFESNGEKYRYRNLDI